MTYSLKLSKLQSMSPQEIDSCVREWLEVSKSPEAATEYFRGMQAEIVEFERRYEMPSDRMLALWADGKIRETAEICSWLMLIKFRSDCGIEL